MDAKLVVAYCTRTIIQIESKVGSIDAHFGPMIDSDRPKLMTALFDLKMRESAKKKDDK